MSIGKPSLQVLGIFFMAQDWSSANSVEICLRSAKYTDLGSPLKGQGGSNRFLWIFEYIFQSALVTKLVDVLVLGANVFDVWVRVPSRAFQIFKKGQQIGLAHRPRDATPTERPCPIEEVLFHWLKAKRVNVLGLSDGCLHQLFGAFRKSLSQGSLA